MRARGEFENFRPRCRGHTNFSDNIADNACCYYTRYGCLCDIMFLRRNVGFRVDDGPEPRNFRHDHQLGWPLQELRSHARVERILQLHVERYHYRNEKSSCKTIGERRRTLDYGYSSFLRF